MDDYQSKEAALQKQMREATDRVTQAELRQALDELRQSYNPRGLTIDLRSAKFYLATATKDRKTWERGPQHTHVCSVGGSCSLR